VASPANLVGFDLHGRHFGEGDASTPAKAR
jgi:hypothetical protein